MLEIYDFNNWVRKYLHAGADMHKFITNIAENPNQQIWVADGFNCNQRRRDIYPEYKRGRVNPGEDVFDFMDFTKECIKQTKAVLIEVPYYEADDVIAKLALESKRNVDVFSTDADMWQLKTNPYVNLPARDTFKCKPEHVVLYKATVGDKSDNIPGLRGFGDKAFEKMIESGEVPEKVEQSEDVQMFLKLVNFITPSFAEIDEHTIYGLDDRKALNLLLEQAGLVSLNGIETMNFNMEQF